MIEIIKYDSFAYLHEIQDKYVDVILTDVPYDLDYSRKQSLQTNFLRIARKCVIVFSPPENQWILPADQYLFWIKPISTKNTSKSYSRFVEMMFVYQTSVATWNTNRHWSQYTNVFTDLVDDEEKSLHPYRKPVSLLRRLILNHTREGDTILDPFAGSGSIIDACLLTKRNCIAIEQDATYYNYLINKFGEHLK